MRVVKLKFVSTDVKLDFTNINSNRSIIVLDAIPLLDISELQTIKIGNMEFNSEFYINSIIKYGNAPIDKQNKDGHSCYYIDIDFKFHNQTWISIIIDEIKIFLRDNNLKTILNEAS